MNKIVLKFPDGAVKTVNLPFMPKKGELILWETKVMDDVLRVKDVFHSFENCEFIETFITLELP